MLSWGVLPSVVKLSTLARYWSKKRITPSSFALRSDAQDLTTNPPHNHNTLIVSCTKKPPTQFTENTRTTTHTATQPNNLSNYNTRSIKRTTHSKPFNYTNITCDNIITCDHLQLHELHNIYHTRALHRRPATARAAFRHRHRSRYIHLCTQPPRHTDMCAHMSRFQRRTHAQCRFRKGRRRSLV